MAVADDAIGRSFAENQRRIETLDRLSQRFGQSLTGALSAGTASGKQLSGVLDGVAGALAKAVGSGASSALAAGLQGAMRTFSAAAMTSSFGPVLTPFARGGVPSGGGVTPFAAGGVVAAPTYFPLPRGLGLMGEAGAEAVMPLARGSDGRLGVRTAGAPAPNVTVNIAATDVESFKRSEAQVAAALARALARGRRAS